MRHSERVKWPRRVSIVDVCVGVGVLILVLLPERSAEAIPALDERSALAVSRAEAAALAHPQDGLAAAEYTRALGGARELDWAVDASVQAARAMPGSPTRWRVLLAASVAHADRYDAKQALELASEALLACSQARTACPSWEEIRVQLYASHLSAGVASGIDPKVDPVGFRRAAEAGMTSVRLSGAVTAPAPEGSGATGSAGSGAP
jgi:hypothetical protein